jgi:hypothetical protein
LRDINFRPGRDFLCYNLAVAPKAPHILPGTGIKRP